MLDDPSSKQAGIARLMSDLRNAKVDLLSAQCAVDRLRLQYSVADIVSFGEPQALKGAIAAASTVCSFLVALEDEMKKGKRLEQ